MAYNPGAVANFFLKKAWQENLDMSPMKLQKIVYFAHGWYLALYGKPLINEPVEAWKYGPVIPTLYHEYKRYGQAPIKELFYELNETTFEISEATLPNDPDLMNFLTRIWDVYKSLSAIQLSNLTHEGDSPWARTYSDSVMVRGVDISNSIIQEYFKSLMSE